MSQIDDLLIQMKDLYRQVRALQRLELPTNAVLLTGNQTVAGVKTFSNGIAFANETLSAYDEGTWTPVVTGSTGNPTITYTLQNGTYTRIGNIVFYKLFVLINTTSGGSGDLRVSLPLTVTTDAYGTGISNSVDLPGTSAGLWFAPITATAYGTFSITQDNTTPAAIQISGLAAGDWVGASGFYFV